LNWGRSSLTLLPRLSNANIPTLEEDKLSKSPVIVKHRLNGLPKSQTSAQKFRNRSNDDNTILTGMQKANVVMQHDADFVVQTVQHVADLVQLLQLLVVEEADVAYCDALREQQQLELQI
jgi:hypothetical protein